jgi:dihydroxyacid dehydratase/phosphogluconate dehydratase
MALVTADREFTFAEIDGLPGALFSEPVREIGGLVALFGNLAPHGAILKRSAADPTLFDAKDGQWCSSPSRIWRPASTIRRWMSKGRTFSP